MVRFIRTAMVLGAVAVLAVCASPAPAAKGVKKNGRQQVSGRIVTVNPGNQGQGSITIQVTHHRRKKGQAARRQPGQTQTFTVTRNTRLLRARNGRGGLASLRAGEQVVVAAHQRHADIIAVQQMNRNNRRSVNRNTARPANLNVARQVHRNVARPANPSVARRVARNVVRPANRTVARPANRTVAHHVNHGNGRKR